jgi:pyrroline-5-carboxylate reductase
MLTKTIALIGGGHITEIIIENLTRTKTVSPERLIVSDPVEKRRDHLSQTFSVQATSDNLEAAKEGEIVFINVRPQVVDEIVEEFSQASFLKDKVLVTIAAGVPMEKYKLLGKDLAIVRALPNPPSQVGQGLIAVVFNEHVSEIQRKDVLELFDSMGEIVVMKEDHINATTALTSPAPILLYFKSMIEAGARAGMERDIASKIAYQTIVGVMEVWKKRQVLPDVLIKEACTPGGISEECVATLDKHGFRDAIGDAIRDGTLKAEKLGRSGAS